MPSLTSEARRAILRFQGILWVLDECALSRSRLLAVRDSFRAPLQLPLPKGRTS